MVFKVRFVGGYPGDVISIAAEYKGLKWLDHVRNALGLYRFPAKDVPDYFEYFVVNDIVIEIDESDARRASGLFHEESTVKIRVPYKGLNKFAHQSFTHKMGDNGVVRDIENYYDVDECAILVEWRKAGYPLKWDPK